MTEYTTHVKLVDGRAEVRMDDRSFDVARRDKPGKHYGCPVELLIAALGS